MIIQDNIAVVYEVLDAPAWASSSDWAKGVEHKILTNPTGWMNMQANAKKGRIVILEAWTMGKCISN